jgi:hypothetical protein
MSAECKGTPTSPFRGCSGAREPIGYVSAYGADARPAADEPSESAIARESLQSRAEEGASKIAEGLIAGVRELWRLVFLRRQSKRLVHQWRDVVAIMAPQVERASRGQAGQVTVQHKLFGTKRTYVRTKDN